MHEPHALGVRGSSRHSCQPQAYLQIPADCHTPAGTSTRLHLSKRDVRVWRSFPGQLTCTNSGPPNIHLPWSTIITINP